MYCTCSQYQQIFSLFTGEQGALNMLPLFLIDKGFPASTVGFWTGVVGQVLSIFGSIVGGAAVSGTQ